MVYCYYVRRSISFYMHTKTIYITEKKIWLLGKGGSGAVLWH